MKTNKLFIGMASLVTAIAFTACSQDETEFQQSAYNKGNVISLTYQLAQTRAASDPQTTALSTSNKVGVFVTSGSATITNGNNNEHSVGAAGALTTSNTMNYPTEDGAKVNIYAYAPYASGMALSSDNAFSVSTDQSAESGYLASDLVYASKADQASTEDAVSLTFAHKLSQLQITIQNEAEIDLSSATVYITGTKTATTFNPSTGAVGTASGDATAIKAASISAAGTVYAIVAPQDIAANTELVKIVAGGKQYVAKLTNAATLAGSKAYKFTVKLAISEEPVVEVPITMGTTSITEWGTPDDLGEATMVEEEPEYSPTSFPSYSGYDATTHVYTWSSATGNLMTILEFSDDLKLTDYATLEVTVSNLSTDGKWRLGFIVDGGSFTNFQGFSTDQAGTFTLDIANLKDASGNSVDASKITKIQLGGSYGNNSVNSGSLTIAPSDVVLKGTGTGSSGTDSGSSTDETKLYATFGTPGNNANYDTTSFTYSCTQSYSNLMNCFTFTNGELANYSKLVFTISELTNNVRINFCYGTGDSDNLNISTDKNGSNAIFGSAGTKTITMEYVTTALATVNKTLADVTSIRFGGASTTASCVIKASEMYLEK